MNINNRCVYMNDQLVVKTFDIIPEYVFRNGSITNITDSTDTLDATKPMLWVPAMEGTHVRAFYADNRWHLSTYQKISADDSHWCNPKSFGTQFDESINMTRTELFDCLDKQYIHTFLITTTNRFKTVCEYGPHPDIWYTGSFALGTWDYSFQPNPIPSVRSLVEYGPIGSRMARSHCFDEQGIMILDETTFLPVAKIYSDNYYHFQTLRDNQPNIYKQYIRLCLNGSQSDINDFRMNHRQCYESHFQQLDALVQSSAMTYEELYKMKNIYSLIRPHQNHKQFQMVEMATSQ